VKRLNPGDTLAVAGDLFDTRYGSNGSDYNPERIRSEFLTLKNTRHYVYGNCDTDDFLKGYDYQASFTFEGLPIILNHGHRSLPDLTDYRIVIEGHSHVPRLDTLMGMIFLNPGSPILPRNGFPSYAVIENGSIQIVSLPDDDVVSHLVIDDIPVP
jgi:putative phosphoesterase